MTAHYDRIWRKARLATLDPARPGLGVIEDGAVAARDGRLAYVGREDDLTGEAAETIDCGGRWITPGLIDCHTHLVHGGDRAHEFELRLAGATYAEIAAAGGGIVSTVKATRQADEAALVASALPRLDDLLAEGVTTVEVKSGYGLELDTERRMLRAARRLGEQRRVGVVTTFLGAHAFPPELPRQAYVDLVCDTMLPAIAAEGLADAVDAFCDKVALTVEETERVFQAARRAGLPIRVHAEQLGRTGGTQLAARYGALSADHVEYAEEADAVAMAQAGMTAVLLPGAFHMLRETQLPPVEAFRAHGVPMAVSTDLNPGTSPMHSLLLAMNMACVLFRLTVPEAIAGVTREAARALGRLGDIGTLEAGKRCDLAIWSVERLAELPYRMGTNPLHARVFAGA
ncbi:imidazolonepropionase [Labrys wisconsinensis]|uniref:Imidazolonepropionase n=1 Tax=Labrys wisconsinensis TaxID=425677 RepID=A0ABU0J2N5_9HYPH|nr:imidazolonepropionase [Labrys wisconsinensis]MDQ0467579.1 imidazolonepropionase [Labrys wisconsinensis]